MLPALHAPDSTVPLLREGHTFISRRCDRLGTDGFRTNLMGKPVTCVRGADAARTFYGDGRFNRDHTFPKSALHLLQDEGSVQSLHGETFTHRKAMFVDTLQGGAGDVPDIGDVAEREWRAAVPRWQRAGRVVLLHATEELFTRAGAAWAGVPLHEREVRTRAREFHAMLGYVGHVGPANWWARAVRNRNERWAQDVVARVRSGEIRPPRGSALDTIATFRDAGDGQLDLAVAAVELINVLRPIASVSRFVAYAALALLQHPQWHEAFADGQDRDIGPFVQEVRRLYPFFTFAGGRATEPVTLAGQDLDAGDWALLDLYGTNHDPSFWQYPEAFRPERFRDWSPDAYQLVPQGAGEFRDNHRCPGEPMTIALMEQAVRHLTRSMRYQVGVQNFNTTTAWMNPVPKDGFVVHDVTAAG